MSGEKTTITCGGCGTQFCLDANLERDLRESGRSFYCPNGHSLSFQPSEVSRLRAAVARLTEDRDYLRERVRQLQRQVEAADESAHAYRMLYGKARKQAQRVEGLEA